MNTRITVDLQNPQLLTLIRLQVAHEGVSIRELVVKALESYLSNMKENKSVLKLSEATFEEWDNPKDSEYDAL